jgi:ABC-type multidrug transport system ATPase subunit
MDEPTAGLDPHARTELIAFLRNMQRSMLIATHDLEAVAEVADRVLLLDRGILFDGSLSELMARPGLLEEAGLEPPQTAKLFTKLKEKGYGVSSIPMTVDQSVAEAIKVIEREKSGGKKH